MWENLVTGLYFSGSQLLHLPTFPLTNIAEKKWGLQTHELNNKPLADKFV